MRGGDRIYMLAGYSDCTTGYRGPLAGGAVHVVATGTPNERLFKWEDWQATEAYANSLGLTQIDNVPVVNICQQAIDDLYRT